MHEFIIFRKWSKRSGTDEAEVIRLIEQEVIPAYERLEGCKYLGLVRLAEKDGYIATQHWADERTWNECSNSPEFAEWMNSYSRTLDRWDQLMEFDEEWQGVQVVSKVY